jgi:hypothetical protein
MTHYFLCHNPMGIKPEGFVDYIYNSHRPRFFAGLLELDPDKPVPDMDYEGCNVLFSYTTATGVKKHFILIASQNIDKASEKKLTLQLHDAAKFYVYCLSAEDVKQHNKQGGWFILEPYSALLPDVQLLQNKKHGNFLLSYSDGIKTLGSFEEVKTYMHEVLEYDEKIVKGGMLNSY